MPSSPNWSGTSAPCRQAEGFGNRFEWRPSRILVAVLLAMGSMASVGLHASELPPVAAWPFSAAALGYTVWLARTELRKPRRLLVIADDGATGTVDGLEACGWRVAWRGSLAFVSWLDPAGRRQRLVWWPDTLSQQQRRELRLAAPFTHGPRASGSMAP